MKYIVNSIEAYSDSDMPKIGINVTVIDDKGRSLITSVVVVALSVIEKNINMKDVVGSLTAIVEKFAQLDPAINKAKLDALSARLEAKEQARLLAHAFTEKINAAIVLAHPEVIVKPTISIDLLPTKVNPPPEPIFEEPIEVIK